MGDLAEVVRILDEHSLIDSESYQRRYQGTSARAPGHYIVRWHAGRPASAAYDDRADWAGPFEARADAEHRLDEGRARR